MTYTDPLFLVPFAALLATNAALRRFPVVKETLIVAFSGLVIASWGLFDLALPFAAIAPAGLEFAGDGVHLTAAGRAKATELLAKEIR